ncbi:hypothetical protein V6Z11_A09G233100 [Gossypium hirsutum]
MVLEDGLFNFFSEPFESRASPHQKRQKQRAFDPFLGPIVATVASSGNVVTRRRATRGRGANQGRGGQGMQRLKLGRARVLLKCFV